jgi:predicted transcriptional regulator
VGQFAAIAKGEPQVDRFIVADEGRIIGTITRAAIFDALQLGRSEDKIGELVRDDHVTVSESKKFYQVIDKMKASGASVALVMSKDDSANTADIQGIITKEDMSDAIAGSLELFSD